MESWLSSVPQFGNASLNFLQTNAGKHVMLGISIFLIVSAPSMAFQAFQSRKQGQTYNFRFGLSQSLMILLMGISGLLRHLSSLILHDIADLIGVSMIIPLIFSLSYMSKAKIERVEAQASERAKAAEQATPPIEAWPPAPIVENSRL